MDIEKEKLNENIRLTLEAWRPWLLDQHNSILNVVFNAAREQIVQNHVPDIKKEE